jgi:cell division protein FtsL
MPYILANCESRFFAVPAVVGRGGSKKGNMEKLKALIGLLVIAAGFYVAWNMIPPYFHNYQLQDDLDDIARRNSYINNSDDDVKKQVVQKAQEEDVALKDDEITVSRGGSGLAISVKYRIHIDMMVHPVDVDFAANSYNKRI